MSIVEFLKVIVLGIVEGFAEWLPISSTGHLVLIDELIHLNVTEEFKEVFNVVIQLGAILAVAIVYFNKLNPFSVEKNEYQNRTTLLLWVKIFIACLPVGILGVLLDDWIDNHLYSPLIIALTLIIYGVIFIVIESKAFKKDPIINKTSKINYYTALYIGMFQVLSLIPGTSRSGATIIGAMILGCSRSVAAEFSFFLGLPIILGASLLKIVKYSGAYTGVELLYLLLGVLVAFFVSAYSVNFLINWVKKHDFKLFGYYRIVLGIIVLVWFMISSLMKVTPTV